MEPQNKKDRVVHTMVVLDPQMGSHKIGKVFNAKLIVYIQQSITSTPFVIDCAASATLIDLKLM